MPDTQPLQVGDQPVAKDAVADPDEPYLGVGLQDRGGDGHDIVVSLELEEPGDRREGDFIVGQPQLAPDLPRDRVADSETHRRPFRCRRSRTVRGRPTPAASACLVMASQTLTIAWQRRAAQRSRAM